MSKPLPAPSVASVADAHPGANADADADPDADADAHTPGSTPWDDPHEAARSLALEDFPSFRITRLATLLQRALTRRYLEQYGVSVPEWRTLCALAQFSPLPVGSLLKLSGYDKALVSRALHAMQTKGLVALRPDPTHGRRLDAEVTGPGRALYERILPDARRRQAALLVRLTLEERRGLYGALAKLQRAFDDDPE